MIQQETRLRVADNSGATVRRSRTQQAQWVSREAQPNGLLFGAALRQTGVAQ